MQLSRCLQVLEMAAEQVELQVSDTLSIQVSYSSYCYFAESSSRRSTVKRRLVPSSKSLQKQDEESRC